MTSNAAQVIVTTEGHVLPSVHAVYAHHRDYPEVRGEGESPQDAGARLAQHLSRTLDDAPSGWRRDGLRQAIEDVREFIKRCVAEGLTTSSTSS